MSRLLGLTVLAGAVGAAGPAPAQGPSVLGSPRPDRASVRVDKADRPAPPPGGSPASSTGKGRAADSPALAVSLAEKGVPRYRIRDELGKCVVSRLHGKHDGKVVLMQPDGQLGFPSVLVPTTAPFVPMKPDELRRRLERGPFEGFAALTTPHYLVFYQSRLAFAQDSARLLEDLYRGLIDFCHRHDIEVHESEFPLVAVIFATEQDFRAHKQVDPEVQAYYEIFTNRIFFYEQSERDRNEPKLVALRKPQTVAHEGAHQILANIGVQPRLGGWPLWLTEGFAEFCATPARTRKGALAFNHLGTINALHMATLRELDDPLTNPPADDETRDRAAARPSRLMDSEALITKTQLTPTDYAQSWALTYYLTQTRQDEFKGFLRSMSRMPPLESRTPEQHLAEFRKYFGDDPAKLDRKVEGYIRKLSQSGKYQPLPYYAVIFEQPLAEGMVRRKAWITQSPQMIQRWVEQTIAPQGGMFNWDAFPFPTKARAELAAENWIRGY